jgi:hypothetical protein
MKGCKRKSRRRKLDSSGSGYISKENFNEQDGKDIELI